jgi:AbrB family looped-hinge helix DNA binding protein
LTKESQREVLGVSKITYKFQITIPKRVREKFFLKEGEMLVFVEEAGKLILIRSTEY